MIMYKLHVRGFTMDSGTRSVPGTFRALMNRIPYLKKLGVTTIELMPVYEFEEIELPKQQKLPEYIRWKENRRIRSARQKNKKVPRKVNYWGYEPGNYFAVKASYAADPLHASREFRMLIRRLHENGMECVMEMYFPEKVNHNLILEALRLLGAGIPCGRNPSAWRTSAHYGDCAGWHAQPYQDFLCGF